MIIHESSKVFCLLCLLRIHEHVFLHNIFLIHKLDIFSLSSQPKTLMLMKLLFTMLWMSLIFTGHFMHLKPSFLENSLSAFVILLELWSAGFKYLIKVHLQHSLSSIFWILILFLDGLILSVILYNCFLLRDYILKY